MASSEVQIQSCHVGEVTVESPPVSFLYSTGRKALGNLFLQSLRAAFVLTVTHTKHSSTANLQHGDVSSV